MSRDIYLGYNEPTPTKGYTMKIQKPSRKTKNVLKTVTVVGAGSAITVYACLKGLELRDQNMILKTNLLQAYTLIKKVDELHADALADAVKACDKELIEAIIARTS